MGDVVGFDLFPSLSKDAVDGQNWHLFFNNIKERYQKDALVKPKPNYLEFKIGGNPLLPIEGYKFLCFRCILSDGAATEERKVALAAELKFGAARPDEPELPATIAECVSGIDPMEESGLPLFAIQTLAGKGRGLVARFNIAKGTRILSEKPLLTTPNLSPVDRMEEQISTKLKSLCKAEQRQFLSLHNNFPGKHPFSGIVKTNALPCGPNSVIGGLYSTICLINHSCIPNCHNSWNSNTESETIHAIRSIEAGEEITISYDNGSPSSLRRPHLKDAFGFDCTCELCSLPPPDIEASDLRRYRIQTLDNIIGDGVHIMEEPAETLSCCYVLLELLNEEYRGGPGALVSRLYYDAFQICITHSDEARASVFAEMGYRSRVICEGEDSPETQKIKSLWMKPADHRNFGISNRWRNTKMRIPRGLDPDAFKRWLWRQDR
ncbi:hypothetical protein MauCBS54593_000042 [Microsporum audouinii]